MKSDDCAQSQYNARLLQILHGCLYCWRTWCWTPQLSIHFVTKILVSKSSGCRHQVSSRPSKCNPNMQLMVYEYSEYIWWCLSHNFFQYLMNRYTPLMISGPFLIGSGLQGFGPPSRSIHFSSLSWCHTSIPSSVPQLRVVHKSLNCIAGTPSSLI